MRIIWISLFLISSLMFTSVVSYNKCLDYKIESIIRTYTLDSGTGERVWSHCGFPTAMYEHARCNMTKTDRKRYLCDPDGLIKSISRAKEIDDNLIFLQGNISTVCTNNNGNQDSFMVGVALINRIRVPDLQSQNICIIECGEIQPKLNTSMRMPTEAEKEIIMKNFADSIRLSWKMGSCENDVIVLYCQQFGKVRISVGQTAAKYLTESKIAELTTKFTDLSKYGRLEEALDLLIQDLRITLRGITPAHMMLLATLIFSLLFGAFLIFFLLILDLEYDIWGQENHWWLVGFVIQMITGLYIIKGLVLVIFLLSHKVHYFGAIICFVLGVLCFILYGFIDDIFPKFVANVRH